MTSERRKYVEEFKREAARRTAGADLNPLIPLKNPVMNLGDDAYNRLISGDSWILYIGVDTQIGWLYLAGIQDAFSRWIVGWSMSERLTKALVCDAWHMGGGATRYAPSVPLRPGQPVHQ